MARTRGVRKVFRSKPTIEGAGVRLKRAFGFSEVPLLDPFLLLDDFHSDVPEDYLKGFPWHPHRGIETITYVLHGSVEHGDSMGNSGVIGSGNVQWMTAGSGVIHQEMPRGDRNDLLRGVQLWTNLPATDKMMSPRYRDVKAASIPAVTLDSGVTVRLICGELEGRKGAVRDIVIDPKYMDVTMPPGTRFIHPTHPDHTVLAYVMEGRGLFCRNKDPYAYEVEGENYFDMQRDPFVGRESLLLFDAGSQVEVSAGKDPVRFLLLSGKPIGEPVAWHGPVVMNTQEELRTAFEEYRNGTFIRDPDG